MQSLVYGSIDLDNGQWKLLTPKSTFSFHMALMELPGSTHAKTTDYELNQVLELSNQLKNIQKIRETC